MKKLITLLLIFVSTVALFGCNPPVTRTAPTLLGVNGSVTVRAGQSYDPLSGVTASDTVDGDLTGAITHTFKSEWLSTEGSYSFVITVSNSADMETSQTISLTVGRASNAVINAPSAVTYYIGSRPFDPLQEISAYDITDNSVIPVELEDDEYTTAVPGKYSYVVSATDDGGGKATTVVQLYVKANANIPNTLSKEEVTIELWHSNGDTIATKLTSYAAAFEAKMKADGYNVKVRITKNGANYDELRTNVINALKGGSLPTLVQNYPDHVVEYNNNKVISSLSPYINHPVWGYDTEGETLTDILASYRQENRATNAEGDYLSLPFNKSTEVIAYNKDLFDDVLEGRSFPTTWQDLFALVPKIMEVKDSHIDRIAAKWAESGSPLAADEIAKVKAQFVPFTYDSASNAFITLTRQFGGVYTSRDSAGKGQLDFATDPNVVTMLNYFGTNRSAFTTPSKWEVDYASDQFKKGYTALAVGSTGGVRYNTPISGTTKLFNIGVAPMLYDKDSPSSRTVIQQGTNISLVTSDKHTADQRLASWLFLKYLTSNEVQVDFGIATGYSPVRDSSYSDPRYLEYLANADRAIPGTVANISDAELVVKAWANKVASQQRQYQFYDDPFIGSSATRTAVGVAFERVVFAAVGADLEKEIRDAIAYALAEANKVV